jgi:hypothetical protein
MASERLINLEECAHAKDIWEALESQFRRINVSLFIAHFLRLFDARQQLEKHIKIEDYYSMTKQIIRNLKRSVDKSFNADDIHIYLILE